MRVAIPTAEGRLAMHFGHCAEFTLVDVAGGSIISTSAVTPPPHAPGVLPVFLKEQNVTHIIAGGMGQRAQDLFAQNNIEVIIGAAALSAEELVKAMLDGTLQTGANICDH